MAAAVSSSDEPRFEWDEDTLYQIFLPQGAAKYEIVHISRRLDEIQTFLSKDKLTFDNVKSVINLLIKIINFSSGVSEGSESLFGISNGKCAYLGNPRTDESGCKQVETARLKEFIQKFSNLTLDILDHIKKVNPELLQEFHDSLLKNFTEFIRRFVYFIGYQFKGFLLPLFLPFITEVNRIVGGDMELIKIEVPEENYTKYTSGRAIHYYQCKAAPKMGQVLIYKTVSKNNNSIPGNFYTKARDYASACGGRRRTRRMRRSKRTTRKSNRK